VRLRRRLRAVPSWVRWLLGVVAFVVLILLFVVVFPVLLRPGLSGEERTQLTSQGADKLVAAENDRSNAQNNVRTTLLQGIAGLALLTGAYFAYQGLEAGRRQLKAMEDGLETGRLQLKATEDGQITTRYTEAVKQLGDEAHVDIRIGGIYALKRIAEDSKDRDAPTIIDLLSAFVRRRSRRAEPEDREGADHPVLLYERAPDVQVALTVMTDLHLGSRIAIFGANLTGADLYGADLNGADLYGAYLTGADLYGAHLTDANLIGAFLTGADLSNADLTLAHLYGAHLNGAHLYGAELYGANLRGANLRGANLNGAQIYGDANLIGAFLTGADLSNAFLTGAFLTGADLTGADLTGADLTYAHLDGAHLTDAILNGASGADFSFAHGTPTCMPDGSPGIPLDDVDAGG
jgi:uncharacterized protein YjbI with pentapeptide repeats